MEVSFVVKLGVLVLRLGTDAMGAMSNGYISESAMVCVHANQFVRIQSCKVVSRGDYRYAMTVALIYSWMFCSLHSAFVIQKECKLV